jgi:RNA-dependent RNA polymerase
MLSSPYSIFTDGAGLCSENVARAAARSLGHYSGPDSSPSTIQVRIGGAKGVLTVWPWMVKYQYSVRQSMEKFSSPDRQVNVIRVSH